MSRPARFERGRGRRPPLGRFPTEALRSADAAKPTDETVPCDSGVGGGLPAEANIRKRTIGFGTASSTAGKTKNFEIGQVVKVSKLGAQPYIRDHVGWSDKMLKFAGLVGILDRPTQHADYWKVTFFFATTPDSDSDDFCEKDDYYNKSGITVCRCFFHRDHLEAVFGDVALLLHDDTAVVNAERDRQNADRRPVGWNEQMKLKLDGKAVVVCDGVAEPNVTVRLLAPSSDGSVAGEETFSISPSLLVPLLRYDRNSNSVPYCRYRISKRVQDTSTKPLIALASGDNREREMAEGKIAFRRNIIKENMDGINDFCMKFGEFIDVGLDSEGWSGLMTAVHHNRLDATEMLLMYGADPTRVHHPPLGQRLIPIEMALNRSPELFSRLLFSASDDGAQCGTADGGTLLHLAINAASEEHLRICLAFGSIDFNKQDVNGSTALHLAVKLELEKCVEVLLSVSDVDASLADLNGDTPLSIAVDYGNVELAKMILEARPHTLNFTTKDDGWNLLMISAVRNKDYEMTHFLLDKECDVDGRSADGKTTALLMLDVTTCAQAEDILLTRDDTAALTEQALKELHEYIRVLELVISASTLSECDRSSGNSPMHVVLGALSAYLQRRSDTKQVVACLKLAKDIIEQQQAVRDVNLLQLWSSLRAFPQLVLACFLALIGAPLDSPVNHDGHTPQQLLATSNQNVLLLIKQYHYRSAAVTAVNTTDQEKMQRCAWCEEVATVVCLPCDHRLLCLGCARDPDRPLPRCLTCKVPVKELINSEGGMKVTRDLSETEKKLQRMLLEVEDIKRANECIICKDDDFTDKHKRCCLPCGHDNFHKDCLLQYQAQTCPICRKKFSKTNMVECHRN